MGSALRTIFEQSSFAPHGFCLMWQPALIWLHAGSDALIGLSYFSIPLALWSFVRRRPDVEFRWIAGLFALFILACGTTHFMGIITLWLPLYWLDGGIKFLTAIVSVVTAILLWPLLPRVVALPSPTQLRVLNEALSQQIEQRDRDAAALRESETLLRQAQKMEALGQLAGGIAHDFNNVLQVVSGGLALIQRRSGDANAVRGLAKMAIDATERGASIAGRLLAFAREDALRAVSLAPVTVLEGMRELLTHTLGSSIVVETKVEPSLPNMLADKAQLETVLVNLAINARDAMPSGGTLTLSAEAETVGRKPHRAGLRSGDYVRLTLSDTGQGMDRATLARAGEPFFTTKPPGHGTGLGLAMARGFAGQSGGGFVIDSALARGTSVTLWLPVASLTSSPEVALDPALTPILPVAQKQRIMVVDDDIMVRDVLKSHLEDQGYQVVEASDGMDALATLDSGTEIDLLVSDFTMPGMNGLMLIEEVQKRRPNLPTLLLTGYADSSVRQRLDDAADTGIVLLRKPVSGETLASNAAALLSASPASATAADRCLRRS
jgi:signal transduction histidine kinase/ActR/RegA family two-component response regulator